MADAAAARSQVRRLHVRSGQKAKLSARASSCAFDRVCDRRWRCKTDLGFATSHGEIGPDAGGLWAQASGPSRSADRSGGWVEQ